MTAMNLDSPHFLLIGNPCYTNRGGEAIVRGTMVILRHAFGPNVCVTLASYGSVQEFQEQARQESDAAIRHVHLWHSPRFSAGWWMEKANRTLGTRLPSAYASILKPLKSAAIALQVGGDHYTLDYGRPVDWMATDRFLWSQGQRTGLWGASIGPFDQEPEFLEEARAHLSRFELIFVRETASEAYLQRIGIRENVHVVADPAFVMEAIEPPAERMPEPIPSGAIGVNLSSLMAKYVTGGDLKTWKALCVAFLSRLLDSTGRTVILTPHVVGSGSFRDDHIFLEELAESCRQNTSRSIRCLRPLGARELKWAIARCEIFVGSRTHATIAALSSCVPTLSLAYSTKAVGINQDIFGSLAFCIQPAEVTADLLFERVEHLTKVADQVRSRLAGRVPAIKKRALHAGDILREALTRRERP